ncbi:MAG: hypothetical protein RLZZ71_113 [Bacteroidota bacterium]|jgi:uncharacterized protein with HEPN domain
MEKNQSSLLYDILNAIIEIEFFLDIEGMDFTRYVLDLKTKRAVERNLEIVGEAMNRLVKGFPDFKLTNSRKIIDVRNRIIHGYDSVSDEIIWTILNDSIPPLKTEVEKLLGE